MTAELALRSQRAWLGRGKWLVRRLRELDGDLAVELLDGHRTAVASGDLSGLIAACDRVLDTVGGRLTEGFVQRQRRSFRPAPGADRRRPKSPVRGD